MLIICYLAFSLGSSIHTCAKTWKLRTDRQRSDLAGNAFSVPIVLAALTAIVSQARFNRTADVAPSSQVGGVSSKAASEFMDLFQAFEDAAAGSQTHTHSHSAGETDQD